ATRVFDRTRAALLTDETYDVVIDTVAGPSLEQHLELLRPNGRYVLCGGAAGPPGPDAFTPLLRNIHKSPTLIVFSLNSLEPQDLRRSWKRVTTLLREDRLSPVLDSRFPLAQADSALRHVEFGRPFGKVVLLPG
ncbi:zinc-binding dehydrogenase, partial [Umezawaea endophytica]